MTEFAVADWHRGARALVRWRGGEVVFAEPSTARDDLLGFHGEAWVVVPETGQRLVVDLADEQLARAAALHLLGPDAWVVA